MALTLLETELWFEHRGLRSRTPNLLEVGLQTTHYSSQGYALSSCSHSCPGLGMAGPPYQAFLQAELSWGLLVCSDVIAAVRH